MPIRIERDEEQSSYQPRTPRGGGGGGGGNIITNLLPVLLGLFGRNPKLLIIVAIIGALFYFLGGKGCMTGLSDNTAISGIFSQGAEFDIKKYSATEIYEPLADNLRNPMPERISLLQYAPHRLNQGQQGSCVAWASAYGARSIMEARETGQSPDKVSFSPSFLYNQIALEGCQGSYLAEAMKVMQNKGLVPFNDFPYTDQSCSEKPGSFELQKAEEFKIDGYQRLTKGDDPNSVDLLAIKQNIMQGAPVVIGMMVGGSFMQNMLGQEKWIPTDADYNMSGFGGHAMCVIGYDDYAFSQKMGGFEIMNSWGEDWGKKGIGWISYSDFEYFVKEAFGLYPMGNATDEKTSLLDAKLGIVLNADDQNLSLNSTGGNYFHTSRPMKKGEKFKLQVTNNIACYIYVFAMESDGSSSRLFPYTEKHSPYCGITGTRLFPRDHSLFPDEIGTEDYFVILISKSPVDYNEIEKKLDAAIGNDYREKVSSVTGKMENVSFTGGQTIQLRADFGKVDLISTVIAVSK
ncbi:MAG: DUF4384 domain-containing protein [Crocinitomicaceae bacterium]|nr:DUF4384 domain-containing protein [Crocinitomicaceae bacterium]